MRSRTALESQPVLENRRTPPLLATPGTTPVDTGGVLGSPNTSCLGHTYRLLDLLTVQKVCLFIHTTRPKANMLVERSDSIYNHWATGWPGWLKRGRVNVGFQYIPIPNRPCFSEPMLMVDSHVFTTPAWVLAASRSLLRWIVQQLNSPTLRLLVSQTGRTLDWLPPD